jgi:hypothetical protein
MPKDIRSLTFASDRLLGQIDNPRHRAIIENYRLHTLLEASGRWPEIFTRGLLVDQPHYRIHQFGEQQIYDGLEAIQELYAFISSSGLGVFVVENEHLAVADWGLAAEISLNHYVPGQLAGAMLSGHVDCDLSDVSATYLLTSHIQMVWHYDEQARARGELGYEDEGVRSCIKLDNNEVITQAAATAALNPIIASIDSKATERANAV